MPDYANFDGTPYGTDDHKDFRFDAWRTLSNVAVDDAWFAADPWQVEQSNRVLDFLSSQGIDSYANQYTLDGKPLSLTIQRVWFRWPLSLHLPQTPKKGNRSFRHFGMQKSLPASGVIMMECFICWACCTTVETFKIYIQG